MLFLFEDTVEIQSISNSILEKLGHKIRDPWEMKDSYGSHYLTLRCCDEACRMLFDLNCTLKREEPEDRMLEFVLWHGCASIALFHLNLQSKFLLYENYLSEKYLSLDDSVFKDQVVCKKFACMV